MMSVSGLQLMFPCSPCTYSLFQLFYFYTALYVFYPLQLPPQSSAASHTDQNRTCPHLNVSSVFIIDLLKCLCVQEALLYVVLLSHTDQYRTCPHLNVSSVFIIDLCLCVQEALLYVVLQSHTDQYRTCPHLNASSVFIIDLLKCLCVQETLLYVVLLSHRSKTLSAPAFPNRITHRMISNRFPE